MKREARNVEIHSIAKPSHGYCRRFVPLIALTLIASPTQAHASLFHGETLDAIANGISWVVLVVAPIIGVAAFWLVHILLEKNDEKKKYTKTREIKCMYMLSFLLGVFL